jgi:hypothetical protein
MDNEVSDSIEVTAPSASLAALPAQMPAKTPAKKRGRGKTKTLQETTLSQDTPIDSIQWKEEEGEGKEKRSRFLWDEKMEEILIYSLVNEVVYNGKRADTGYKNEAWEVAIDAIWDYIGHEKPRPTKLQLQTKHD